MQEASSVELIVFQNNAVSTECCILVLNPFTEFKVSSLSDIQIQLDIFL